MADPSALAWRLLHVDGPRWMSRFRRVAIFLSHRHARIRIPPSVFLGPRFALWIPGHGQLDIGENVSFRRGFTCEIAGEGRVTIGARTVFTSDALIQCSTSVDIGADCALGQALLIVDGNHRFRDPDIPMLEQGYDLRPVRIGAGTAVTSKCSIIGAEIGERCFIGAGSTVTRDIPDFCLAAGTPARVLEYYGPADRRPASLPGG